MKEAALTFEGLETWQKAREMVKRIYTLSRGNGIARDFGSGLDAEEICARSLRELRAAGADKVYVSNLGNRGAMPRLRRILERV